MREEKSDVNSKIKSRNLPGPKPFLGDNVNFYLEEFRIIEFIEMIKTSHVLSMVGDKGEGKTSFLKSGVIPYLKSKEVSGQAGSSWNIVYTRPGTNPIGNFAYALEHSETFKNEGKIDLNVVNELELKILEYSNGIVDFFQEQLPEPKQNILLVLDQIEDIFNQGHLYEGNWQETVGAFVNALHRTLTKSNLPIYLVISINYDYLKNLYEYPLLNDLVNKRQYHLNNTDPSFIVRYLNYLVREKVFTEQELDINQFVEQYDENGWNLYKVQLYLQYLSKYRADLENKEEVQEKVEFKAITAVLANKIYERLPEQEQMALALLFRQTVYFEEGEWHYRIVKFESISEVIGLDINALTQMVIRFSSLGLLQIIEADTIDGRLEALEIALEKNNLNKVNETKVTANLPMVKDWPLVFEWCREEENDAEVYKRLAKSALLFQDGKESYYSNPELELAIKWYEKELPVAWAKLYDPHYEDAISFLQDSINEEKLRVKRENENKEDKRKGRIFKNIVVVVFIVLSVFLGYQLIQLNDLLHETHVLRLRAKIFHRLDSTNLQLFKSLKQLDTIYEDNMKDNAQDILILMKQDRSALTLNQMVRDEIIELESALDHEYQPCRDQIWEVIKKIEVYYHEITVNTEMEEEELEAKMKEIKLKIRSSLCENLSQCAHIEELIICD